MIRLSWNEVRDRARQFSKEHADDWSEAAHKQTFWNDFFKVFGLRRSAVAAFEQNVVNTKGNTGKIDLFWKGVLIVEQKSRGQDLDAARDQAFEYIQNLTAEGRADEIPRYVVCCDFAHLVLYDLEPEEQRGLPLFDARPYARHAFPLADFERHVTHFAFVLGQTRVRYQPEDPANEKAYTLMCELHDRLAAGGFTGHALERLLVRILFCLFAEDTRLFDAESFTTFIRQRTRPDGSDLGGQLNFLFEILNTPRDQRQTTLDEDLAAFPYVNGGLFEERLNTPVFTRAMRESLLACGGFYWERVSPAVFGSLFQGILDDRARRQQGAHYTSERDIMKVVHSLFLDDLRAEWTRIRADRSSRRRAASEAFLERLRGLRFLDPACGCGNFLVLAYRELRALETDVLKDLSALEGGQTLLPVVNVDQFYGIEIGDWPARIAEVALWLMDHQMNRLAAEQFAVPFERLPLRTAPNIAVGNALRLDWSDVLPCAQCSYVLGNPPFIGKQYRNPEQQNDMALVWEGIKGTGVLDYVTCWYVKAARYVAGTRIAVAFVSTNSISQGEQVGVLWGYLFQRWPLKIHFAHRTFAWTSDARGKAHVHVVIVGFGAFDRDGKTIFEYETLSSDPAATPAANISPYLVEGNDICLTSRRSPICDVPAMSFGSMPNDGGHFLFAKAGKAAFLAEEPDAATMFRRFVGAEEFLNGIERWCLWLVDFQGGPVARLPRVKEVIKAVQNHRRASDREATRKLADSPMLFGENRQPTERYILVPGVSSERRKYIPVGFLAPTIIASNLVNVVAGADYWHLGVLSSAMHMAWVRIVAGRLKSDFRYSANIVYNNFPWPDQVSDRRRAAVAAAAEAMLELRVEHGDGRVGFLPTPPRAQSATLAELYDPLSMPAALAKAHADLDRAVERCYRPEPFQSDRERVELLFRRYETLTAPLLPATPAAARRRDRGVRATGPRRGRTPGLSDAS